MADDHPPLRVPDGIGPPSDVRVLARAGADTDTATLLGRVMSLVAVAIGFLAVGSWLGRDLSNGVALLCSFAGFGMLLVQAFAGDRFRTGDLAIGWLFSIALVIGLGLGPVLAAYASADPATVTGATVVTALVVAAMAAGGLLIGGSLVGWLRPLTFIVFALVLVSLAVSLFGDGGSPLLSIAIAVVSALLLLVDFGYVRSHATEDDVVLLATGIFVSIVNIFVSLLNLFGRE